jgi:hypothetical protein
MQFGPRLYAQEDISDNFPKNWKQSVIRCVEKCERRSVLTSEDPTSLETPGTRIEYGLIDGISVQSTLAWLDELYRTLFLEIASAAVGTKLDVSHTPTNGININVLRGKGSRYEWHVDSNPVTGLLFLTTHEERDGGALVFKGHRSKTSIYPLAGLLLIFDARQSPHRVEPMLADALRLSAPMNFFWEGQSQHRPASLDQYLYGSLDTEKKEGATNAHV